MKKNEKIFSKAFTKILKYAEETKKKQGSQKNQDKLNILLCELMMYRLRDIAANVYDEYATIHLFWI